MDYYLDSWRRRVCTRQSLLLATFPNSNRPRALVDSSDQWNISGSGLVAEALPEQSLFRHQETQVQFRVPQGDGDGFFVRELAEDIVGMSRRLLFQTLHDVPEAREGFFS